MTRRLSKTGGNKRAKGQRGTLKVARPPGREILFPEVLKKQRAGADVGRMFIACNLKRVINIVGKESLMAYFRRTAVGLNLENADSIKNT